MLTQHIVFSLGLCGHFDFALNTLLETQLEEPVFETNVQDKNISPNAHIPKRLMLHPKQKVCQIKIFFGIVHYIATYLNTIWMQICHGAINYIWIVPKKLFCLECCWHVEPCLICSADRAEKAKLKNKSTYMIFFHEVTSAELTGWQVDLQASVFKARPSVSKNHHTIQSHQTHSQNIMKTYQKQVNTTNICWKL